MFEGWLGEIITRFVGHFLDVKTEQLRVSLWSGWSTSLVLENVRVKVEAFEYLQLPFNVREGCIGRLEIQVPWRALQSRPVVLHLSDVWLCACPRTEAEWEEGMAGQRAQAAKQAELAALDLIRLSKPGGKGAAAGNEGSSLASSFLSHLGTMLLNRLQMTIRNIHVCFKDDATTPGTEVGLRLQLLETTELSSARLGAAPGGAKLVKDMHVEGLSLYWKTADSFAKDEKAVDTVGAWLDTMDATSGMQHQHDPLEGAILPCLDCNMRLTMSSGGEETVCGTTVLVQRLEMQVEHNQLCSMVALADRALLWSLRSKYAIHRPAGWRSDPDSAVPSRRLWQYAIKAVLQDVKKPSRWLSFAEMSNWQQQRRQYEKLHLQRLDAFARAGEPEAEVAKELEALEAQLPVNDILLYRLLAEHKMQQREIHAATDTDAEPAQGSSENARQQSWLGWGVSSVAGYLGYVPSQDAPRQLSPPSELDIQELFHDLGFDPQTQVDSRDASSTVGINLHVSVNAAILAMYDGPAAADNTGVISMEAGDASIEAHMQSGRLQLTCSVEDIAAHDLCTHGAGISEMLLTRWDKEAASPSHADGDMSSPFLETPPSIFASSFLDQDSNQEPQAPALHVHYDSGAPRSQMDTFGDEQSSVSDAQPSMEVAVQPLQLIHRSACFARLQGLLGVMPKDLHSDGVLHAINQIASPAGRALAKAELAVKSGPPVRLHVEVVDFMVVSGGSFSQGKHAYAALCTGPVELQSVQQLDNAALQGLVAELRKAVHANGVTRPWQTVAEQVELHVLYDAFEMSVGSLKLQVSSTADPRRNATQVLFPLRVLCSLRMSKLPDRLLPQMRLQVSVDPVEVSLTPDQVALLGQIAALEQRPDVSGAPVATTAAPPAMVRIETVTAVPRVEVTGRLAGLVATYDDGRGADPDADDTHLMLHAGRCSFVANVFGESMRCEVTLNKLEVSDSSFYTVSPPRIWGTLPRLAGRLSIEQIALLLEQSSGLGFMLSVELSGAEAEGFQAEPGNFIGRLRSSVPTTGTITHINTRDLLQTSVTLQDGCFGAGTLMRIAALFVKPPKQKAEEPVPASGLQASPAIDTSSPAAEKGPLSSYARLGVPQEPMLASSFQPGSSQPTGRSISTEPGGTSQTELERWESASGSFDVDGTATRRSRDGSSSASTHANEAPPDPGAAAQELFALDEELFESPSSEPSGQSLDRRSTADQAEASHNAAELEDHAQPGKAAVAERADEPPPARLDQFSLQILRCRILCPDWRDTSFAPGNPRDADDGQALVLDVPEFLLQLPAQAPMQHLHVHPVQEHRSGAPTMPSGSAQPSGGGGQQDAAPADTPPQGLDPGQLITAGAQLGFYVQVFDPGKGFASGPRRPFLAVPEFKMLTHTEPRREEDLTHAAGGEKQPMTSYAVSLDSLQVTAEPHMLQVLRAAADWGSSEMAHILGVSEQQTPEGTPAPGAQQDSSLLAGPPFRLSIGVNSLSVRVNGSDEADPPLLLGLHALSVEASRAPQSFMCGASFERLLLHLSGMPEPELETQGLDMSPQRPGGLAMGRSASAPSAYKQRTGTVLDALPAWGGLDLVEAGSSSSQSSATSETPVPAVRTTSTGLAELATLGSSPDTWPQPVISGRRGSDVLSWSTALDAAVRDQEEESTPKSAHASSNGSPSFSPALSQRDSGDTFYNASSGAFSQSLHRVSSSGTETSGGSGTEWFEAADYDSDTIGTASSAGMPLDVNGALEDERDSRKLPLLLVQGIDEGSGVLQMPPADVDSSPAGLRAGMTCHMQGHDQTSLRINGVLVRLFTQGWVTVVQRLKICMAALERVEKLPAEMQSRDSAVERHAQIIIQRCQEQSISIMAGLFVCEIVATNYTGSGLSVPYISASLSMHGSGSLCGGQLRLSEVTLPQAALRVGLAQQDGNSVSLSNQHDAGAICALCDAQVGLQGGEHEREAALLVSLERISIWACHSRLCIAMVFAMAMQDLASALKGDQNTSDAGKASLSLPEGFSGRGSLRIGSASVMLSSDTSAGDLPIFDASILDISADATLKDEQINGILKSQICANVYSSQKDGWEPVVEPWSFVVDVNAFLPRSESEPVQLPVQHSIAVSAKEALDLTATFTLAEAIHKSSCLLEELRSVAKSPQRLEAALEGSLHGRGWGRASVCRLQNDTGLPVQCWLGPTLHPDPKTPGEEGFMMVESGASAALSLQSVVSASCRSQLASCPEQFFDEQPPSSALAASASMGALQKVTNPRRSRPALMAVYYKLDGQEGVCGPLSIDRESHGMQEVAVRTARSSGLTRIHLAFDVSNMRNREPAVVLHSGVQVVNHTMLRLNIGERTALNRNVKIIHTLAPHESFCLSACRSEPGLICFQPAGEQDENSHYQWSPSIRLQPLLDLVQPSGAGGSAERDPAPRVARHLACQAAQGGLLQASFCVGVIPSRSRAGWDLIVKAPLVVENALPMPTEISLKRRSNDGAPSGAPMRVSLRPRHPVFLHHMDITHLAEIVIQPFGYLKSPPVRVPALSKAAEGSLGGPSRSAPVEETASVSFSVTQAGESRGVATVQLRHMVDAECGSHILRLTCALWVYNCTGVPLALQQSAMEDVARDDNEVMRDDVPKQWVPPFEGKRRPSSASAAAKPPKGKPPKEGSSSGSLQGLEAVLGSAREDRSNQPPRNRSASRLGVAESLEYQPSYLTPTRWPSMQGGMPPYRRRVRMQLRASNTLAPLGRTYWSDPVQLDSLGGAAVVSVPLPTAGPASVITDDRSAYMLSVTANQVPGADGALAVIVMPRYVVHNSLGLPLQYRQQGTATEKEVEPGGAKALRWADADKPKRLCLRVQEAGWRWSGGIALDSPGDLFVKIRHRDRGVTMLVRVDVCAAEGGVLVINVSHQAAGFTPYRLDNCSPEELRLRQIGCAEQEDVLRPYSHLNYAWDEPSLPHKLVLSLPGNRVLGTFDLDKVGRSQLVTVPAKERVLQIVTKAEGPTCVLTIADLQLHVGLPVSPADGSGADDLGWERWSGPLADKPSALFSSQANVVRAPSALHIEVQLDLAGVGLSFTRPSQEVFYASMSGIRARTTTSKVRHTLELEIRSIQVDNPDRGAIYPVVLAMPAAAPGLSLTILPETLPSGTQSRSSALRARAAAWKRRPACVLCVERLEVHVSPLVLEIDQQHIMDILAAVNQALQPFQNPHSTNKRKPGLDLDVDVLAPGYNTRQLQQLKVYIAHLLVSRVTVYMSFLPAEWRHAGAASADYTPGGGSIGTGMQRLVALVGEVEGGRVSLAPLRMEHPLLGTTALQQQVYSHYMRAALPELVKLVGSANVLGDPVRLFHHLGAGVWSFLASPAAGLVEGARGRAPERFAAGVAAGLRGLLSNIVYGFASATAKMSRAARQGLVVLGFEPRDAAAGPLRARLRRRGEQAMLEPGFLDALLSGLVGVLSEPVRGADEGGLPGLVRGAARGAVGALVLPLAAVLETSMRVADSIRSAVMGIPPLLPRARPPRHVAPDLPLAPYNWSEAMGRALLVGLERGRYAAAPFLLCRQLAGGSDFAVLTRRRLLCICAPSHTAPPSLRWAVALEDLFHIRRQEARLVVVALQPSVVQPASPIALLRRPPLVRPSRSPLFSATLACKGAGDAEMLQQAVEYAQASAQVHSLAQLLERISHSQHWWQARAAAGTEPALLTGGELSTQGGLVVRRASEELTGSDSREELLAAQILAAVRRTSGTREAQSSL